MQGQVAHLLADKARLTAEAATASALSQQWQQRHEQLLESSNTAAATAAAAAALSAATAAPALDDDELLDSIWPTRPRLTWADGPAACATAFESFWRASRVTISRGEALWADKKKRAALRLYKEAVSALCVQLPEDNCTLLTALFASAAEAETHLAAEAPAKAAFTLKRALDEFVVGVVAVANAQRAEAGLPPLDNDTSTSSPSPAVLSSPASSSARQAAISSRRDLASSTGAGRVRPPADGVEVRGGDFMSSLRIAELEVEVEDLRRWV